MHPVRALQLVPSPRSLASCSRVTAPRCAARVAVSCPPFSTAPSTAATPFPKPVRVVDPDRLRPRRKWADVAPYVASVDFVFDPAVDGTTSCKCVRGGRGVGYRPVINRATPNPPTHPPPRELWRQTRGQSIRKAFPKYTVGLVEVETPGGAAPTATIRVKFVEGSVQEVQALHKTVPDILDELLETTVEALIIKEELAELDKA